MSNKDGCWVKYVCLTRVRFDPIDPNKDFHILLIYIFLIMYVNLQSRPFFFTYIRVYPNPSEPDFSKS